MSAELSSAGQQIIYQVRAELARLEEANQIGEVSIFRGKDFWHVEVFYKLEAIPIKTKPPQK